MPVDPKDPGCRLRLQYDPEFDSGIAILAYETVAPDRVLDADAPVRSVHGNFDPQSHELEWLIDAASDVLAVMYPHKADEADFDRRRGLATSRLNAREHVLRAALAYAGSSSDENLKALRSSVEVFQAEAHVETAYAAQTSRQLSPEERAQLTQLRKEYIADEYPLACIALDRLIGGAL
ncbi:MAG TPA: hypothetical protein VFQ42_22005 [Mycobacterium sp.]|nr:hypothetical protein [Mycobacterium sp.]